MGRDVLGIGLALIPYCASYREMAVWPDAHVEKICRLEGMPFDCGPGVGHVECRPVAGPFHSQGGCVPAVFKDRKAVTDGIHRNPGLCCTASYRIADQTHRDIETVSEHFSEVPGDGGESCGGIPAGLFPFCRIVISAGIHIPGLLLSPFDSVGCQGAEHIEEPESAVVCILQVFGGCVAAGKLELHIGLPAAHPDFSDGYVLDCECFFARSKGHFIACAGRKRWHCH